MCLAKQTRILIPNPFIYEKFHEIIHIIRIQAYNHKSEK